MTPATHVLLSGAISFGVPLLLALRELVACDRPTDSGEDRPPPDSRLPRPPKPLPDCLLPKPVDRPRVRSLFLEDA